MRIQDVTANQTHKTDFGKNNLQRGHFFQAETSIFLQYLSYSLKFLNELKNARISEFPPL